MSQVDLPFGPAPRELSIAAPARSVRGALRVLVAWCLLVLVDVALRAGGFHRFYRMMQWWPTLRAGDAAPERVSAICAAIARARIYYFKHAWCLQRSAAAVCFLRLRGVPAELVIGVRKIPFYAHAWAEVGGTVVNDQPTVRTLYPEMVRC
jgi:hypothetical protein